MSILAAISQLLKECIDKEFSSLFEEKLKKFKKEKFIRERISSNEIECELVI
uniref:Uncharacterized protein n=1 Tax=Rhizophagus irregularis (strain DAOM 181602 / DAOM 197198 / MUCL 43194) TaxID=747089 RepID=U9THL2_RHIID